jgi:hypothetical protein
MVMMLAPGNRDGNRASSRNKAAFRSIDIQPVKPRKPSSFFKQHSFGRDCLREMARVSNGSRRVVADIPPISGNHRAR